MDFKVSGNKESRQVTVSCGQLVDNSLLKLLHVTYVGCMKYFAV